MTSKIGVGIISFAHGHARSYCQRLLTNENARLVACWDDDATRGQKAAADYGMTYSPHLEDLLQNPEIHGVIITCETARHAEMTLAAAAAGKHILCQKPMALTLADCDRMTATAQKAGVKFMMAHQMRHDPSNLKIKELLENGKLGKISLLRRRHCIPVLLDPNFISGPSRWHFDPAKNIGMWFDDAAHATDFIHWMLGRPVSVIAEIENTVTNIAPDDTGVAVYKFASGAMAVLVNSSVTLAGENTTEIYGDRGVLIQNYDDAVSTALAPPGGIALKLFTRENPAWQDLGQAIPAGHGERIAAVPEGFVECIRHDLEPIVTAHDGRVAVEMLLGAYQSAREGRRISFPLVDE